MIPPRIAPVCSLVLGSELGLSPRSVAGWHVDGPEPSPGMVSPHGGVQRDHLSEGTPGEVLAGVFAVQEACWVSEAVGGGSSALETLELS